MRKPFSTTALLACGLATMLMTAAGTGQATQPGAPDALATARSAQSAYEQGMLLRDVDSGASRAAFQESADGWRRLITAGHANARTWSNLGNAELGSGAIGESIAAYLEADRLNPGDRQVRTNLSAARNQVPMSFDADGVTVLYDTVSDGWHVLGFDARWWVAAVSWIGFWGVLMIRMTRDPRPRNLEEGEASEGGRLALRAALISLGGIALIASSTVALDVSEDAWRTPGVLVQESVARSGNGESFSEVFAEPLPPGLEFEVVESRPGWHKVQFADERTGWLRTDHTHVIGG